MKILLSTALALLVSITLGASAAFAEVKLDQVNASNVAFHEKDQAAGGWMWLSQTFTPSKTGKLTKVSLKIQQPRCGPQSSDLVVKVYGPVFGTASTTVPASRVPSETPCAFSVVPNFTDVTFPNPPQVFRNGQYRLSIEPEGRAQYNWYFNMHSYQRGAAYTRRVDFPGYLWEPQRFKDYLFRTYIDVPDTDGDGLTDDVDQCDEVPGPASNNGCPDNIAPRGTVVIDGGKAITRDRMVLLRFSASDQGTGVAALRVRNGGRSWLPWQNAVTYKNWKVTRGPGLKTVYVQYRDRAGNVSNVVSDRITFRP